MSDKDEAFRRVLRDLMDQGVFSSAAEFLYDEAAHREEERQRIEALAARAREWFEVQWIPSMDAYNVHHRPTDSYVRVPSRYVRGSHADAPALRALRAIRHAAEYLRTLRPLVEAGSRISSPVTCP